MKIKEATQVLETLGWQAYTDEVGDKYTHFKLPDRTVKIIYGVDRIRDQQKFGAMLSLSTVAFSKACARVDLRYGNFAGLA